MKTKILGLMAIVSMGLSACSQSRMGLAGRFQNVYLLNPVSLVGTSGAFVIQVDMTDNVAYLYATDLTQAVASQNLRLLGAQGNGNYDILNPSFRLNPTDPNSYVTITPKSGLIASYNRIIIETTTTGTIGVGLTPEAAAPGAGQRVLTATVTYSDLQNALNQMGTQYKYTSGY